MFQPRPRRGAQSPSSGGLATGVDLTVALLFPMTWISPNLIYTGLFEMLAAVLAAEFVVLLALFTVTKRHIADTREAFRSDWNLARWAVLLVVGYEALAGELAWSAFVFIAAVLASADFPLRIGPHAEWRRQLNLDVWILLGITLAATLVTAFIRFPPVPYIQVPPDGIVHDIVVQGNFPPQGIFALGTLYFVPKAILNGYRHLRPADS
ncbi:MAG: hypothetical protein HYY48_12985 [Gammaproteobacteria bacterium]|nr:hypothetical protein [Gammaproteobacteria bacterium]